MARKSSAEKENGLVAAALVAMIAVAAAVVFTQLRSDMDPAIDTRYESGSHLVFVLIAPTSTRDRDYSTAVKQAKAALRGKAREAGYLYSTVGVSDDWAVERALIILAEFGSFDELVVGRNWLNTGVKAYVTDMGGRPAVPQVVVMVQDIHLEAHPEIYRERREVVRIVGRDAMQAWAKKGFALPGQDSGYAMRRSTGSELP